MPWFGVVCEACAVGKQHAEPFPKQARLPTHRKELVHTDADLWARKNFEVQGIWLLSRLKEKIDLLLKSRKLPYVSSSKKWLRRSYILCERSYNGGFFCSSDQKQNGIRPLTLQSWMESQSGRTKQSLIWLDVKRAWWQKRACLNLTGNWPHGSQYYSSVSAVEWHKTCQKHGQAESLWFHIWGHSAAKLMSKFRRRRGPDDKGK